ncbi:MAG TPA: hypothetical protein VFR68_11970 [Candidatus Dormibacteraeota bacterium]|nr:hypothetical protein [Candidatus Dormibacteraeota bacterium]
MKPIRIFSIVSAAAMAAAVATSGLSARAASSTWNSSSWRGCASNSHLCTEVDDATAAFGHYVGHDEPSVLFYSNQPGSGNRMQYNVTLPVEPKGPFSDSKGYSQETSPAFWFGMAMCDTQSYPESSSVCTPDSDSNIVDPTQTKHAPGVAYMELQFYPPGFAPQFAGFSCDATQWCAALTIDSLSENPFNGSTLNPTCTSEIGGSIEYINFAYLTHSGKPIGPPNPLQFQFIGSGDPHSSTDTLFMNQGDNLTVSLHDSASGLVTTVVDNTTGQTGSMTASAANDFGQIKFQSYGNSCQVIPYDFHPMYSTSGPKTRVLWAAHTYNIAMDAETGHFDFCSSIDANTGACNGTEGVPGDTEPAEYLSNTSDDFGCFSDTQNTNTSYVAPAGQAAAYCVSSNDPGFDGTSFMHYWPNNTKDNATAFLFSSPRTGANYTDAYPQAALETDLPRIEAADFGGSCVRSTGVGCTNPPPTDDGQPATFYPYFSTVGSGAACQWGAGELGGDPTGNNSSAQFGSLLFSTYWRFGGHGATTTRTNNYNSGPMANPC